MGLKKYFAHERKSARSTTRVIVLMLILWASISKPTRATMIAPHALFIDHRVRSTALYIHNPDDQPVEIQVELIYGFPQGDGEGGVHVFLEENPAPEEPSCASWVRALPRRVVLQPGERQTIRLLARPPAGLPDGEYWSRVLIRSTSVGRVEELEETEGVQVGLNLSTRTIISLNYRKGPVTTGIEVPQLRGWMDGNAVFLSMDLKRRGNAAWLGQVDVVMLDEGGEEIMRWDRALAVYRDYHRDLELTLDPPASPGDYTLSLRFSTEREDLPPEGILPSEEILRSMALSYQTGSD
jgi:hypothetical protein